MGKKNKLTLQELAEYMRDAAYSDDQSHHIRWSLSVIHPKTNDGDVGFSGGLWTDNMKTKVYKSVSFSFSDSRGITDFHTWIDHDEIRHPFGGAPSFEDFKETIIKLFAIEQLYQHD